MEKEEKATVELLDINGKLIHKVFTGFLGEGENRIDLSSSLFPANGIYFVKLKSNDLVQTAKISISE